MSPPQRIPFVAGNWKMFKTVDEARRLAEDIAQGLPKGDVPRVGLFPNAVALEGVVDATRGCQHALTVGAQDIYFEDEGAYTGQVSAAMVASAGATAVLVGHSERRHVFGETDSDTDKKVCKALAANLEPVLCVGEKLEEREAGQTMKVVERQLTAGTAGVDLAGLERVVIAYGPVWAIGTGKTATPEQGQEVHHQIRQQLRQIFASKGGAETLADATLILYGGSVKPENAGDLLAESDIDGLLVGGASLKADSFLTICQAAAG